MFHKRVVVTGMGVISPLGYGVQKNWKALKSSKSGIRRTPFADENPEIPSAVAGVIPDDDFPIGKYVDSARDIKRMSRFVACGIIAAGEAVEDSGLLDFKDLDPSRVGVFIGSGIGGLNAIENNVVSMYENGWRGVSPFFITSCLINMVTAQVSIKFGFKGPSDASNAACSSGAMSIASSIRAINMGEADVVISGGSEAVLSPFAISSFAVMKALSTKFNDFPEKSSRPWDIDRCGFVMGEGAGILVLESYDHAKARGAEIYAEILGCGVSSDAFHVAAPDSNGDGARRAMEMAIKKSGIALDDVCYINAHATSTKQGDRSEYLAIKDLFGQHSSKLSVSSSKSSIGHLLGASGAVEAVYSILALRDGIVPPTLNLDNPDPDFDIDFVPHFAKEKHIRFAMSNSFGFGGSNVSLLISCV